MDYLSDSRRKIRRFIVYTNGQKSYPVHDILAGLAGDTMRRREFLTLGSKLLATGVVSLGASKAFADGGCTMISPALQRCDVGIPFGAATQKAKQQHMSEWCWAASISMAFAFHGYDISQERIVAEAWGGIVNLPGSPEAILSSVNRRWKADDGRLFEVVGTPYGVSIPAVVQDLQANYPVLIGTMGHMMVLTHIAWIQNAYGQWQIVDATVRDPWPLNPSRRTLNAVEWANTQIAVRVRTRALSSDDDDDDQ